jgi:gas vesicle protein
MGDRGRTIFLGVLLGAATGLVAAMLINRRAAESNRSTAITSGEGLKLGVLILGLLRAISALGDDEKKR